MYGKTVYIMIKAIGREQQTGKEKKSATLYPENFIDSTRITSNTRELQTIL